MFVIPDKYLNCVVDKTIDTGHTASTNCTTNYGIILLLLTSWFFNHLFGCPNVNFDLEWYAKQEKLYAQNEQDVVLLGNSFAT